MKIGISKTELTLAKALAKAGYELDLRCGGKGTCRRCEVELCSGVWRIGQEQFEVNETPVKVKSCQCFLVGAYGEVEVPEKNLVQQKGNISESWSKLKLSAIPGDFIALDIGTTTLAMVKIHDGKIINQLSCFNPQSCFGDNVISRINHASSGPPAIKELQKLLIDAVNGMLKISGDNRRVSRFAVAGNTVMTSLFYGIDPTPIGVLPFKAPCRIFPEMSAAQLGINLDAEVLAVPAISGYVGGDITAGFHAVNLKSGEMLIDLGTNCEIIFSAPDGIFCTAAAAGPAFEGANISCGMRAVAGAIDRYYGKGEFSVLGGVEPLGLCGSGMIDFLAVEYKLGHLNAFGRIVPPCSEFPVAGQITLSESDIEQLLKAKAAVIAGIITLEEHCKLKAKKIYLAGGFARYINIENAVAINLLPERQYEVVGNTSLGGAAALAADPALAREFERLIDLPKELPLNLLNNFENNYIDGLLLNNEI